MTHPVKLDELLERYEYIPLADPAVYVCEGSEARLEGCICGRIGHVLDHIGQTQEAIDRCESLGWALDGWLAIGGDGVERWVTP